MKTLILITIHLSLLFSALAWADNTKEVVPTKEFLRPEFSPSNSHAYIKADWTMISQISYNMSNGLNGGILDRHSNLKSYLRAEKILSIVFDAFRETYPGIDSKADTSPPLVIFKSERLNGHITVPGFANLYVMHMNSKALSYDERTPDINYSGHLLGSSEAQDLSAKSSSTKASMKLREFTLEDHADIEALKVLKKLKRDFHQIYIGLFLAYNIQECDIASEPNYGDSEHHDICWRMWRASQLNRQL